MYHLAPIVWQRTSRLRMSALLFRSKLAKRRVWRRVAVERLTEPLHLNLLSLPVLAASASYGPRWRGISSSASRTRSAHWRRPTRRVPAGSRASALIEVGVASGAGLVNLSVDGRAGVGGDRRPLRGPWVRHRRRDAAAGRLPGPSGPLPAGRLRDGRRRRSPPCCRRGTELHLGPLASTIPPFLERLSHRSADRFCRRSTSTTGPRPGRRWSCSKATPELYLPRTPVYVDDITLNEHNSAAGATWQSASSTTRMP